MLSGGLDSSSIVGIGNRIKLDEKNGPVLIFAAISNFPDTKPGDCIYVPCWARTHLQAHLISETEVTDYMDELVQFY